MCGIVGYNGNRLAVPILIENLKKLEYRGYDSSGLAVFNEKKKIEIKKASGRISVLEEKVKGINYGNCGIGHTRWATHGEPTEVNAHPHFSDDKSVAVVHNGIIENYSELKLKLEKKGYKFYSQTDTEVLTKLIHYYWKKYGKPMDALARIQLRATGSYAICVMFNTEPDVLYCVKKDSPMVIGINGKESFVASDASAIAQYTNCVYYLDNHEMARVRKGEIEFYTIDQEPIKKQIKVLDITNQNSDKGDYAHYMLKEIYEQPIIQKQLINEYTKNNSVNFSKLGIDGSEYNEIDEIHIIGCGSAYHVGLCAKPVIESVAKIKTQVHIASEFRYQAPIVSKKSLVIAISQSGETADTIACVEYAKENGLKTLGVVNCIGSTMTQKVDKCIYTNAGQEIAVATTKAYTAQLLIMYLFTIMLAKGRDIITAQAEKNELNELRQISQKMKIELENVEQLKHFASLKYNQKEVFFLGRGIDYASGEEGSLKLKEISYIHSECFAAGEMKHGTISLVQPDTLIIGITTQKNTTAKTLGNLIEVKSRGACVVCISDVIDEQIKKASNYIILIPKTNEKYSPLLSVIPMQLLAYYIALNKGEDIDKPRNLAKSVTVE